MQLKDPFLQEVRVVCWSATDATTAVATAARSPCCRKFWPPRVGRAAAHTATTNTAKRRQQTVMQQQRMAATAWPRQQQEQRTRMSSRQSRTM
jgi:hypothetical protein